jgi:chromosome segregation ATPase
MSRLLTSIFPNQEIPPGSNEGLPYWIFWLMLLAILLLLTFIFLRDKDMRRRLDSFFAGFRKKIKKARLQQMLKREQKKIETTLHDMGESAWSHSISIPSSDPITKEIIGLEEKTSELMEDKNEAHSKINSLNKDLENLKQKQDKIIQEIKNKISPKKQNLENAQKDEKEIEIKITQKNFVEEETAKKIIQAKKELLDLENQAELSEEEKKSKTKDLEDQIKKWQQKKKNINDQIKNLIQKKTDLENKSKNLSKEIEKIHQDLKNMEQEKKQESKKFQKEIREWEKTRDKTLEKIKKIEEEKKPFVKTLGRLANEKRVKSKELSIYYSKIDRSEKRIKNIKKRIEEET